MRLGSGTRALAVLVAALLLALVGCGDDDEASTTTEPPDSTVPDAGSPEESTTTTAETEVTPVSVYFMHGDVIRVGYGREAVGLGVAAAAMEALLAGPNADDEALGLETAIPEGTELLGLNIVDDLATVDLSREFESGGGSLSMNARLAQVVYTVTQFPSVRSVTIHIDGAEVDSIGGEGLSVAEPLGRADFEFDGRYEHLAPAILVESPRPGDEVADSIRLTGRSNTFEATFVYEVLDEATGEVLVDGFDTATSGTGTPGDFDTTIDLPPDPPDRIVLLVFEESAESGERINLVELPLAVGEG